MDSQKDESLMEGFDNAFVLSKQDITDAIELYETFSSNFDRRPTKKSPSH